MVALRKTNFGELVEINSLIRSFAPALQGITNPNSANPAEAFSDIADAFGFGFLGDVIEAGQSNRSSGAFSLNGSSFGNLAEIGLNSALGAALGPLGGIATDFLGRAFGGGKTGSRGNGGGLGGALSGLADGIRGAIDSISDALGGNRRGGTSTTGRSRSSTSRSGTASRSSEASRSTGGADRSKDSGGSKSGDSGSKK